MTTHTQKPLNKSVSDIHNELIHYALLIGAITEGNSHFTAGLAQAVQLTGKPLSEMSVTELSAIICHCRKRFNTQLSPTQTVDTDKAVQS